MLGFAGSQKDPGNGGGPQTRREVTTHLRRLMGTSWHIVCRFNHVPPDPGECELILIITGRACESCGLMNLATACKLVSTTAPSERP
jgi:hypothetical protein